MTADEAREIVIQRKRYECEFVLEDIYEHIAELATEAKDLLNYVFPLEINGIPIDDTIKEYVGDVLRHEGYGVEIHYFDQGETENGQIWVRWANKW